jgi:hypothetical protein
VKITEEFLTGVGFVLDRWFWRLESPECLLAFHERYGWYLVRGVEARGAIPGACVQAMTLSSPTVAGLLDVLRRAGYRDCVDDLLSSSEAKVGMRVQFPTEFLEAGNEVR